MSHRLSGLQLAILRALWNRGEATVADVREAIAEEHPLAYSTVATVMARLEKRGVIRHRADGRTFFYQPVVGQERIRRSLVSDLVERVFNGSPAQLVSHLLATQDVDDKELQRIKRMLAEFEASEGGGGGGARRPDAGEASGQKQRKGRR